MDKLGQVITCKNLILLPWLQPWVSWRLPSINITAHRKTTGFLGGAGAVERETKRHGSHPWVGKIPWRRQWKLIPVFLPGESHAQRSLAGYTRVTPRGTRLKRLSTGKLRAVYTPLYFVKPSIEMLQCDKNYVLRFIKYGMCSYPSKMREMTYTLQIWGSI